jgi:hypothetical protein
MNGNGEIKETDVLTCSKYLEHLYSTLFGFFLTTVKSADNVFNTLLCEGKNDYSLHYHLN